MNCYNHPDTPSVAPCMDCQKGLCKICCDKYSNPICRKCNINRIENEKSDINSEFIVMIGGAILGIFIMYSFEKNMLLHKPLDALGFVYMMLSLIAGWYKLEQLGTDFDWLPIIGIILKLLAAACVGIIILPYTVLKNTVRKRELNKTLKNL